MLANDLGPDCRELVELLLEEFSADTECDLLTVTDAVLPEAKA